MHGKVYTRKMSYNERLFAAADRMSPPVVNQLFFDGKGFFEPALWRDAVRAASAVNPGSRLRLKGFLAGSRWIDSFTDPQVIEVDGGGWDGSGPESAPFLQRKMNLRNGRLCQVLLIHGEPLRVCFRTHHSVMDGRGTLTWAEDIFRVLRGEEPAGTSSDIADIDLAKSIRNDYRTPFKRDSIAPSGIASGGENGVTWKRVIIHGRFKNVLGRVALLAAREAWRFSDGPVRFSVPVDLRPHVQGLRSTANLSIAIYIEVTAGSTPESISADIKKQLTEKSDCLLDRYDPLISYVPISLLTAVGKTIKFLNNKRGRYGISGIISNMAQVPLDPFCGGGFTSTSFWGIPPAFETVPFFMGIAYSDQDLQLILTMPKVLANNNRINMMLENIKKGLIPA